jgi:hypothetical protein
LNFHHLRVAKHPTASAPGVPASGRGWAFAFGAYLACYLIWFFVIFIGYTLIFVAINAYLISALFPDTRSSIPFIEGGELVSLVFDAGNYPHTQTLLQ